MRQQLRPACILFVLLTLLTGAVYPLVVTVVARLLFPHQAEGSLVDVNGRVVGSELIGQLFSNPRYFWGRPSATSPVPYNAASSSGSNLGPTNPALINAVGERIAALRAANPSHAGPVPIDLVTASGSGLDPHISPASAYYQVARVARARGIGESAVRELVERHIEGPVGGVLGAARLNLLRLNLALDALKS